MCGVGWQISVELSERNLSIQPIRLVSNGVTVATDKREAAVCQPQRQSKMCANEMGFKIEGGSETDASCDIESLVAASDVNMYCKRPRKRINWKSDTLKDLWERVRFIRTNLMSCACFMCVREYECVCVLCRLHCFNGKLLEIGIFDSAQTTRTTTNNNTRHISDRPTYKNVD